MSNDQSTIDKLYRLLDFQPGKNLATPKVQPKGIYQAILFDSARKKLGIDSMFFCESPSGSSGIPHIYFRRLEGQNPAETSKECAELHRLAWNMGQAPLLFVTLPIGQVLIYNTYIPPTEPESNREYQTGLIESLNVFSESESERRRLLAYHRREFESGHYWQRNSSRFDPRERADQTLLENLKFMRQQLLEALPRGVPPNIASEIVHSLLGRSIFVKYLEDRKDTFQSNIFPDGFFEQFHQNATCFTDVLVDKRAAYRLFDYLSEKFNGDIFPVGDVERKYIRADHLQWLRTFLTGEERLPARQLGLWKFYSFDVIPIEFISNIYEEFFHIQQKSKGRTKSTKTKTGTHYTPHHLVEFLVDEVLPWEGTETDLKVLDPACGSGIFLVEVYRRLIAHWHQANPGKKITAGPLKKILTDNIFGVDPDLGAVRVAAFSLYLTLCDYLEPRQIWERVKFPYLRGKNLFPTDFFEKGASFSKRRYDLIIGNPPWQNKLTLAAEQYRDDVKVDFPNREVAPDKQIALTFLWRAAELCQSSGEICLLMPSKGLLFNRSGTHKTFRRDFFATFDIKTIVNFSASRHILFEKGVGPGAAIFYTPREPDQTTSILYCTPKPTYTIEDKWQVTIEPQDIAQLPRAEASESDVIWKVAMWGGARDYELIVKLMAPPCRTLEEICSERGWTHGEGFIKGNQEDDALRLLGKPFVDSKNLGRFVIDEESLLAFDIPKLERPRKEKAAIYDGPHILVKQSPLAGEKSFRAALLRKEAVFSQSLVGINALQEDIDLLAQYCVALNSYIPFYFALMSSGRWLVERDELSKEEAMSAPMPKDMPVSSISYGDLENLSADPDWESKVQDFVKKLYDLTEDEQILIDDAINYTLDYFRLKTNSKAAEPTNDEFLEQYLRIAKRTLQNSFGRQFKPVIFQGVAPLRVVALSLMTDIKKNDQSVTIEKSQQELDKALNEVNEYLVEQRSPNLFVRRNVRAYMGRTVYIIKPDQRRYWTRANALRDADEIYADIMEAWRPSL